MNLDKLDSNELERELCKTNLHYLCTEKLGYKDWDVCHTELDDWYNMDYGTSFKVMLLPRYHLKTSFVTIARTIQYLLNKPDGKVLLVNGVWDNARSFLDEIKQHLQGEELRRLFGRFDTGKWNSDEVVIAQRKRPDKTPSIDTAGVEKTLTSQHYDYIIADDLVTRENITTSEQMLKVKRFFFDLLKLLNPVNGKMDIVGTRWHHADLYADLDEENKLRVKKGEYPKYETYVKAATVDGTFNTPPIFPKMWSLAKLKDLEFTIGTYEYSANMNNNPISEKEQIFKPPIRFWEKIPEGSQYYVSVDLATKEGHDFVVVLVGCITPANQMFIVDYKRGHLGHGETLDAIFNFVVQYMMNQKVRKVGIESNAYQKVFLRLVEEEQRKRNVFFESIPIHQHIDKVTRIRGLQPRYESGNLLFKQGMSELFEELAKFPVGRHDDILDACEIQLHMIEPSVAHHSKTYVPKQYRGRPRFALAG